MCRTSLLILTLYGLLCVRVMAQPDPSFQVSSAFVAPSLQAQGGTSKPKDGSASFIVVRLRLAGALLKEGAEAANTYTFGTEDFRLLDGSGKLLSVAVGVRDVKHQDTYALGQSKMSLTNNQRPLEDPYDLEMVFIGKRVWTGQRWEFPPMQVQFRSQKPVELAAASLRQGPNLPGPTQPAAHGPDAASSAPGGPTSAPGGPITITNISQRIGMDAALDNGVRKTVVKTLVNADLSNSSHTDYRCVVVCDFKSGQGTSRWVDRQEVLVRAKGSAHVVFMCGNGVFLGQLAAPPAGCENLRPEVRLQSFR